MDECSTGTHYAPELPNIVEVEDQFIKSLTVELMREAKHNTPFRKIFGETATQLLAIHLLRRHAIVTPKINDRTYGISQNKPRDVLDYIRGNLDKEVSLASLAKLVEMSDYHFARMFKQLIGLAPHQYIAQCRMEEAMKLLKCTNLSVLPNCK